MRLLTARAPLGIPAAAMLLAAAPSLARAQVLDVTVVEGSTGRPLPNTLIALLDSAGRPRGGALTDAAGRAAIVAPAPGVYRSRAERTGQQTAMSALVRLAAGDTGRVRVALTPGVVLPAARAVADRRCPVLPPREADEAVVRWEEVRKALATARAAADARAFEFALERDVRSIGADGRPGPSTERTVDVTGESMFTPVAAVHALLDSGFVRVVPEGADRQAAVHHLPDASEPASEPFATAHCLRPVTGRRARAGQLGLAFAPVPAERGRPRPPGVRGTLWLDSAGYALRELEYEYTDLPPDLRLDRPSGSAAFARRPDGLWYVARWAVRVTDPDSTRWRGVRRPPAAFREEGGRALLGDDIPRAHPDSAVVVGTVRDGSAALEPVAGVTVRVGGLPFGAVTNRAGAFRLAVPFAALPDAAGGRAARVLLRAELPRLTALGVDAAPLAVTLARGRIATVNPTLPSARTLATALCPDAREGQTTVYGTIRYGSDAGTRAAALDAAPPALDAVVRILGASRGAEHLPDMVRPDAFGHYVVCGVPAGARLRLVPTTGGGNDGQPYLVQPRRGEVIVADLWVAHPGNRASVDVRE